MSHVTVYRVDSKTLATIWLDFIQDIGHRIKESTSEKQATSFLMQAIGIAIQRGNSQCILDTVKDTRKMDEVYYL